jgi:hypothetical protein
MRKLIVSNFLTLDGYYESASTRRSARGIVHRDKMGGSTSPGQPGRELEVIAVEAGAGPGAFVPVMHARPSRVAK